MALTCTQSGLIWRVSTVIHNITIVVERYTTAVVTGELWPATRGRGGRNQHDDQDGDHQNHHPHPPGLEKSVSVSGAVSIVFKNSCLLHFFKRHVTHAVQILTTNILSNKNTFWYNTHDIHELLRISTPSFGAIFRELLQQICTSQPANIRFVPSYERNQNVILLKYINLL